MFIVWLITKNKSGMQSNCARRSQPENAEAPCGISPHPIPIPSLLWKVGHWSLKWTGRLLWLRHLLFLPGEAKTHPSRSRSRLRLPRPGRSPSSQRALPGQPGISPLIIQDQPRLLQIYRGYGVGLELGFGFGFGYEIGLG